MAAPLHDLCFFVVEMAELTLLKAQSAPIQVDCLVSKKLGSSHQLTLAEPFETPDSKKISMKHQLTLAQPLETPDSKKNRYESPADAFRTV